MANLIQTKNEPHAYARRERLASHGEVSQFSSVRDFLARKAYLDSSDYSASLQLSLVNRDQSPLDDRGGFRSQDYWALSTQCIFWGFVPCGISALSYFFRGDEPYQSWT